MIDGRRVMLIIRLAPVVHGRRVIPIFGFARCSLGELTLLEESRPIMLF
jgi:hypothetical protein